MACLSVYTKYIFAISRCCEFRKAFYKFYHRHSELIVDLINLLKQAIPDDLVCTFIRIVWKRSFPGGLVRIIMHILFVCFFLQNFKIRTPWHNVPNGASQ